MTDDDEHRGEHWNEDEGLLHSLPKGVRWLPVALFFGLAVLVEGVLPNYMGGDTWSFGRWGRVAALAVVIAVVLGGAGALNRGRVGGAEQAHLFRTAMREGRVPEGADREKWATEVARRLEATRGPRGHLMRRSVRSRRQEQLQVLAEQL